MHSMGTTWVLRQSIMRPERDSRSAAVSPGTSAGSVEMRWCGVSSANRSNQNLEICVSTTPLPGRPLAITTSKALMRSVATINKASPPSAKVTS